MNRHAIPYAAASPACPCPVQACGGIIPNPSCPDHGARRNPAMEWHPVEYCPSRTATARQTGQQPDETTDEPVCGCEEGGEPCDRHEREQAHAEGEHELCGAECTAAGLDASQPATEAHPADVTLIVERRGATDWLMGSTHYDLADRDRALDCLARRRKQFPNNEHRLVRETTTWTVEETDQ